MQLTSVFKHAKERELSVPHLISHTQETFRAQCCNCEMTIHLNAAEESREIPPKVFHNEVTVKIKQRNVIIFDTKSNCKELSS